jgi:hypothetical protein
MRVPAFSQRSPSAQSCNLRGNREKDWPW